jgi:tRNA (mo5U34)-methyltransferase
VTERDRTWYHTIDLPGGGATPGMFDTREAPRHVPWPDGLAGGRCLDVGTFDGFWAFEMERRGAGEVVALDLDDPADLDWDFDHRRSGPAGVLARRAERGPGFTQAAGLLGSTAVRVPGSVYDLDPSNHGVFDVVLCGALLLHLRDPVLALERMRAVCRGALVLVEAIDERLEVVSARWPAARVKPWVDQWWRVNTAGLMVLVHAGGFRVTATGRRFIMPLGPGAKPGSRQSRLAGIVAGRPGRRGVLMRAVTAVPRPPDDADAAGA